MISFSKMGTSLFANTHGPFAALPTAKASIWLLISWPRALMPKRSLEHRSALPI